MIIYKSFVPQLDPAKGINSSKNTCHTRALDSCSPIWARTFSSKNIRRNICDRSRDNGAAEKDQRLLLGTCQCHLPAVARD
jgi:hypothetical protein